MADDFDPKEPYEEMMERLSRGISTWNFNFGTPESEPKPESPASEEISNFNAMLAPLAKSRLIPMLPVLAVVFLVLAAGVKGFFWQDQKVQFRGEPIGNLKKQEQPIRMVKVEPLITNATIEVPISMVEEKKLVSFEYSWDGKQVPLLAFLAPTGKIVTAVGLSEPCQSRDFHIEGAEIVCDLCHTRWDMETLRGVAGECQGESLAMVPHFLHKGRLIMKEMDVRKESLKSV